MQENEAISAKYVDSNEKQSIFGAYNSVDQGALKERDQRIEALEGSQSDQSTSFAAEEARELEVLIGERSLLDGLTRDAKATALRMAAGPAVFMFLSYLVLILWFKGKGGYRPVRLS